ncbi:MAG: cation-transporting P-type ATPase [Acidobacteriaceae bacterium]|nr:cation-transporting P-type ATPase [Acidobacteriaceae bacterium]
MSRSMYFGKRAPHAESAETVLHRLRSDPNSGLSAAEADARLCNGRNEIQTKSGHSGWRLFLRQFADPQMYLLLSATVLSLLVTLSKHGGAPWEALLILSVVLLNAILGFLQEDRAEKALEQLKVISPALSRVIRNGTAQDVLSATLVPGDILLLGEGNIVPADARIIEEDGIQVTEAILTGESLSVSKQPAPLPLATPTADRTNMVFSGTGILAGHARAVVTSTGPDTEVGHIASLLAKAEKDATALQNRLQGLSKQIAIGVFLAGSLCVITFILLLPEKTLDALIEIALFGVSLGGAATPEALGTLVTLTLGFGVLRLARRGAIVRRLNVIDTLGATTVVMSDKTGTLTQNRIEVHAFVTAAETISSKSSTGPIHTGSPMEACLLSAALANAASYVREGTAFKFHGDPVDTALWAATTHRGVSPDAIDARFDRKWRFPFTSERKMLSVAVQDRHEPAMLFLYLKGAPESVLSRSTHEMAGERITEITATRRAELSARINTLALEGWKVMALARRVLPVSTGQPAKPELVESGLTLAGFVTLFDPPREEASETIRQMTAAHIRTILVSGDHPQTAAAIARQLGIESGDAVLTGAMIERSNDAELQQQLRRTTICARVTPADKLRIAQLLQRSGEIVAMTGDGVNDAPALMAADVGIAMGSGTEIAKDAADIVLTDDSLATILHAIREGRIMAANIQKAVMYLFTTNLSEVGTIFLAAVVSMAMKQTAPAALPLTAAQILWLNLMTDVAPAIALALSPARPNVMEGSGHRNLKQILSKESIYQILGNSLMLVAVTLGAFFLVSGDLTHRRTMTLTVVALCQCAYALTLQSESASIFRYLSELRWLIPAIVWSIVAQILVVSFAFTREVFGLSQLNWQDWLLCLLATSSVLVLSECRKFFLRRQSRRGSLRIGDTTSIPAPGAASHAN